MRNALSVVLAALLILMPLRIAAAAVAAVDPVVIGTWEMTIPTPQGNAQWIWNIRPNGTYTFHTEGGTPAPAHSGIVTFNTGRWSLTATRGLPNWRDGGTYRMGNADLLLATGVLGTAAWNRVVEADVITPAPPPEPAPSPDVPQLAPRANPAPPQQQEKSSPPSTAQNFVPQPKAAEQQASASPSNTPPPAATPAPKALDAPKYLPNPLRMQAKSFGFQRIPANVVEMAKVAAGLHKGEFLAAIGIGATPRSNTFHADFDLWSPRTGEISTITNSSGITEFQVTKPFSGPAGRIPLEFTEFTAALDVAQKAGMAEGALLGAGLRVVYIGPPRRVLYWTITEKPKTKDGSNVVYYIDGFSGKLLPGTPDSNRQAITPEWEEAARLFSVYAGKQLPQAATMPDTNKRRTNSCIGPAACRAAEAGDYAAADRIDGAFANDQDIQTYDK